MAKKRLKVAVTGAAGQIGYALLFRIASGQMFGPEIEIELQLLELEPTLPALQGVAMELEDCAFPLLKNIVCTSDVKTAMRGVNWAVLVGAVPRKEGMERGDLLGINGKLFTEQGRAINEVAANDVQVFVVGNPCNTNCLIASHSALDIPPERFYAMTLLDENRAKSLLAKKAEVSVDAVTHMAIWGNHSATQYPDFYHAMINDKPVINVIQGEAWLQTDFITTVQQRGAAVIKARGASSAASAANAIVGSIYQLTHDTPAKDYFSVAKVSHGEYGIEPGLVFSYPCRMENNTLQVVLGLEHNEFAQVKLRSTEQELKMERELVKKLGLIG